MNCCDSLLDENSCRFCLGDASQGGSQISSTKPTYFRVEKRRIVPTIRIFKDLNLEVVTSPNVPNLICGECQKTIIAFYALKKNFQDNEAVLLGKVEDESRESLSSVVVAAAEEPVEENVLTIVKKFLKENVNKCFHISNFTDRLTIGFQE
jgi:Zinc-finger associated domain (zf-AD)